jgi:hypothetical protein
MDVVLFVMKMKALSSISGESDPYFPVTPYMVIETTNGSSAHVDAFKVLVGQLLETAFMIASAILDDILVALLLTKAGTRLTLWENLQYYYAGSQLRICSTP